MCVCWTEFCMCPSDSWKVEIRVWFPCCHCIHISSQLKLHWCLCIHTHIHIRIHMPVIVCFMLLLSFMFVAHVLVVVSGKVVAAFLCCHCVLVMKCRRKQAQITGQQLQHDLLPVDYILEIWLYFIFF